MDDLSKELIDIDLLSRGDVKAFNRLYDKYHKAVHANILKLIKSKELSVEVLQDVFLSLWQNRFKINRGQTVGNWLFVVSYNKSLNVLRTKVRESYEYLEDHQSEIADLGTLVQEEEMDELRIQIIQEAVDELPKRKREVFCLHKYEGLSKRDVGETLGLSDRSVSNYLKEANSRIKAYIVENYPTYIRKTSIILLIQLFLES